MANPLSIFQQGVPGVFIYEDTAGYLPASLATHNTAYMLGFSTKAGAPKNTPWYVTSPEDFANVFGTSETESYKSVELFFAQRSGVGLYFVNVKTWLHRTIAVNSLPTMEEDPYTVTVNGEAITIMVNASMTADEAMTLLAKAVNDQAYGAAYIFDGAIRYASGVTVTVSPNLLLGAEVNPLAYPVVADVVSSVSASFTSEDSQGYICAPEFYENFEDALDRASLSRALDTFCADPSFYWISLVDCGYYIAHEPTPGAAILSAKAERNLLASPRGNSAYYFPYLVNLTGVSVPCSAAIMGLAIKRNRQQGFKEPPAGTQYPINGVKTVTIKVNSVMQEALNPQQINCIRHLPKDGVVAWGARSLSTNPYYRFINTRVILNVLAGTLRGAYNSVIFSAVDGLGALFGRLKGTTTQVCERLRKAGALYGATPKDAYLVICDETNNPGIQLEEGVVALDVYVKPAPTLEVLGIRLIRTAIGQVFEELVESATVADPTQVQQGQGTQG